MPAGVSLPTPVCGAYTSAIVAESSFLLFVLPANRAAIRIASSASDIVARGPIVEEASPSPSAPLAGKVPISFAEDAKRSAREALLKTWELEAESVRLREAAAAVEDKVEKPAKVGMAEDELREAQLRFQEFKSEMDGMDADELAQVLNQMYRQD